MEKETLYLKVKPSDIGKYVIFSGDPWRVEVLKDMLDNPKHIAFAREFNTYTGTYKGVKVTVSSTGIGAPSAAIALEEMYDAGMEVAIRMGTIMGLQDDMLGKFVIPVGAIRGESTSQTYAPLSYPAIADMGLVHSMSEAARKNGYGVNNGVIASKDGFYSEMKQSKVSDKLELDVQNTFKEMKKYGAVGIDMESSLVLTLTRLMGIRGCIVCMCTVLEGLKEALLGEERTKAESDLCRVVLDGIVEMEEQ